MSKAAQASIFREMMSHDGRYLIPKFAYRREDSVYRACESLVQSGHARWIDAGSNYFPGIQATGKSYEGR